MFGRVITVENIYINVWEWFNSWFRASANAPHRQIDGARIYMDTLRTAGRRAVFVGRSMLKYDQSKQYESG